jgi:hypothetical protein
VRCSWFECRWWFSTSSGMMNWSSKSVCFSVLIAKISGVLVKYLLRSPGEYFELVRSNYRANALQVNNLLFAVKENWTKDKHLEKLARVCLCSCIAPLTDSLEFCGFDEFYHWRKYWIGKRHGAGMLSYSRDLHIYFVVEEAAFEHQSTWNH